MDITSGQPAIQVGGTNGWGNDSGWGIMFLAFLAMMGWGGGGFGGRGSPVPNNVATTDTVNQAVQYSALQQANQNIVDQIGSSRADTMQYVGDRYNELQRDIANLSQQQHECCYNLQQAISQQTLRTTEQFAALQQQMQQNEIARLRDQVQDLKADVRMQGVIRFPNNYSFNAGPGPFQGAPLPPFPMS